MTGFTGTPSTNTKPTDVVDRSATSRPDTAAASITETTRPSAEKVLETAPEEVGAPTPAAHSSVSPATGTGTSSTGMGGVIEPSLPPRTPDGTIRSGSVADQYQQRSDQSHEIAERVRLNAMRAGDLARNQGLRGIRTAESFVRENPTASLLAALATGLVLGALVGRSARGQGASRRMPDYDYDDERAYQRDYYYD
jgi:ElaB/YqjD/DUF883 family membrane-anchored ribosome-binding protein